MSDDAEELKSLREMGAPRSGRSALGHLEGARKGTGSGKLNDFLETGGWEIEQALDLVPGLPAQPVRE